MKHMNIRIFSCGSRNTDCVYLLSAQVMSHKVLLQFFVCIVDAQLLQIISVETLKAIHIQNSWRGVKATTVSTIELNVRRRL